MSRQQPEPYLKNELLDRLARQNLELLSELWITRDRLAVLETILEEAGVISKGAVDEFAPDNEQEDKIGTLRQLMIQNVIGAADKNSLDVESLTAIGQAMESTRSREK